jgi:hypothetical protein
MLARRLVAFSLALTLSACATTRMTAEWKDVRFADGSIRGKRVVVACVGRDDAMRRVCEDQWAARLGARGVVPVVAYSIPNFPPPGAPPEAIKSAASGAGAFAMLATQLGPSGAAVVNPGPQVSVGGGGGSGGYRGGGFSFGGVGISFPIGGATATEGMASSTSLTDVASGALVWSGSATTPSSSDVVAQIAALAQVTLDAMQKAGVI